MSKEELDITTQEAAEQLVETGTESPEKSQEVTSEIVTENDPSLKVQEYIKNFQQRADEFRLTQVRMKHEDAKSASDNEVAQDAPSSQVAPNNISGLRKLKRKLSQSLRRVEHADQINDFIRYFESQAYVLEYTHVEQADEFDESAPSEKIPQVLSGKEIRIIESWFRKGTISPVALLHDLDLAGCDWRRLSIESLYWEGGKVSYVDQLLTEPDLYQAFKALGQAGGLRGSDIKELGPFVSVAQDLKSQNLLEHVSDAHTIEMLQMLLAASSESQALESDRFRQPFPESVAFQALLGAIQDSQKIDILKAGNLSSLYELSRAAQGLMAMESEFPEDIELTALLITKYRVDLYISSLNLDNYRQRLHTVLQDPSVLKILKNEEGLEVANQLADFMHDSDRLLQNLTQVAVIESELVEKSEELPIVCGLLQELGIAIESEPYGRSPAVERLNTIRTTLQAIENSGLTVSEAASPDRISFLKRSLEEMPDLFSVTNPKVWSLLTYEKVSQADVANINFDAVRLTIEMHSVSLKSDWNDSGTHIGTTWAEYWQLMANPLVHEGLVKLRAHSRQGDSIFGRDSFFWFVEKLRILATQSPYHNDAVWQWYEQLARIFGEDVISVGDLWDLEKFIETKALHQGVMPITENIATQLFSDEYNKFNYYNLTDLLKIFESSDVTEVQHYLGLYLPLKDKLLWNVNFIHNYEDFKFLAEHDLLSLIDQSNDTYVIKSIIAEKEFIASLSKDKRQFAVPLIDEIHKSASPEIIRLKDIIIRTVLEQDDPLLAYAGIEKIFLQNNLPKFGKHFLVFEQIYTKKTEVDERGQKLSKLDQYTQTAHVSPMLRASGELRQRSMLYADLLKINIDSNNDSLKKFLITVNAGQYLINRVNDSGVDSLSKEEQSQLSNMLEKIQRINSAHSATPEVDVSNNLEEAIGGINEMLGVSPGQSIAGRLVEKYARPLGYTSIEQILERMESASVEASERNVQGDYIKDGKLAIKPGDLVKAVPSEIWNNINQEGLVAREFLGGGADTDQTPFDADLLRVREGDSLENLYKDEYGDLCIVVRNRGQFIETTNEGHDWRVDSATPRNRQLARSQEARNKYELFITGMIDKERHVGIRTGLAATEIDALVISKKLEADGSSKFKREGIYFDIANNGFYIPVTNFEGEVLFSLDDYNAYRLQPELINGSLEAEEFSPENLIAVLKGNPYLQLLYESSVGVGEGYSLEQHTQMVMDQFEKYFSKNKDWSGLSLSEFRLLLALHDVGKPAAVALWGETLKQHEYTRKVMRSSLKSLGTDTQRAERLLFIMDQDILGEYFKGLSLEKAIKQIDLLSDTTQIEPSRLLEILRIFYISDAGSYTEDAGSIRALDDIFDFANTDSHGFAGDYLTKYKQLEERFSRIDVSS